MSNKSTVAYLKYFVTKIESAQNILSMLRMKHKIVFDTNNTDSCLINYNEKASCTSSIIIAANHAQNISNKNNKEKL